MADDFTDPDGQQVAVPTNAEDYRQVYTEFGLKWMLENKDDPKRGTSLFLHEATKTAAYYNNKTFEPEFHMLPQQIIPSNRSTEIDNAKEYCQSDRECLYDYSVTLNRDLAHFTLNYKNTILNIKEINKRRIISCGILETPRFGRKSNFLFVPGTKVTYECNQDFILIGDPRRECLSGGYWDVPVFGYTECLRK